MAIMKYILKIGLTAEYMTKPKSRDDESDMVLQKSIKVCES